MTAFFIPSIEPGDPTSERVYQQLRLSAEADTECTAHQRRIFQIMCRRNGVDQTVRVGDPDGSDGDVVLAILELGRELFTIHSADPENAAGAAPVTLSRRAVYSVIEFDPA